MEEASEIVEFYGHKFEPIETPAYDYSAGPGNLAVYYPPNLPCYKCQICSMVVSIEGPSLPEATRVHLGFGSFWPKERNFWESHWFCEGLEQ